MAAPPRTDGLTDWRTDDKWTDGQVQYLSEYVLRFKENDPKKSGKIVFDKKDF